MSASRFSSNSRTALATASCDSSSSSEISLDSAFTQALEKSAQQIESFAIIPHIAAIKEQLAACFVSETEQMQFCKNSTLALDILENLYTKEQKEKAELYRTPIDHLRVANNMNLDKIFKDFKKDFLKPDKKHKKKEHNRPIAAQKYKIFRERVNALDSELKKAEGCSYSR